jgi:hypothetical protein
MSEEYVKRIIPKDYALIIAKIQQQENVDIVENCTDLCISDLSTQYLSTPEKNCLKKCFYKSFEMSNYLGYEFEKISIKQNKWIEKLDHAPGK